jgi:hypothetical protein
MPKNQFQRPLPVKHDRSVPRHGKPLPPVGRAAAKPVSPSGGSTLPSLSALLQQGNRK